jgi:molybdenum cofactor guanylyltransferase
MISKDQHSSIEPSLKGLVLAGGKSSRMGIDKGRMKWHNKEQRFYMADLLNKFCDEVFISCAEMQENEIQNGGYKTITDAYLGLGPFGAILSAFKKDPEAAWLVIACDLPLLDQDTISYLINHRDLDSTATTFESPHDHLPEPLITIWEPKSREVLLSYLNEGKSCPRKALINSKVKIIQPPEPIALMNANTPDDVEKAKAILLQRN